MSLINVEENEDSWLSEYSATERLLNTISSSIQQRDSQNSSAGIFFLFFLYLHDSRIVFNFQNTIKYQHEFGSKLNNLIMNILS